MTLRTSQSHPLQIGTIHAGGGRLGLTFCPGKCGPSVMGDAWQRDLALDLAALKHWGAGALVTLIEDHEFAMLGVPDLGPRSTAAGLAWHHAPIVDVSTPDARFVALWPDLSRQLRARLAQGEGVVLHCRGGLGRTGLVAALLLIDLGMTPPEAFTAVRQARPGAIETRAQEAFVLAYRSDLVTASLLAGALGDSMGADIEFISSFREIQRQFPNGIDRLARSAPAGWFTDDTQMTLFTAEGLVTPGDPVEQTHRALLRWYRTQTKARPAAGETGLAAVPEMYFQAAPGMTCMSALSSAQADAPRPAHNQSKGCGTIMRVAPVGFAVRRRDVRKLAMETSALTHGHATGQYAAAAYAELLAHVALGAPLDEAVPCLLRAYDPLCLEVTAAVRKACDAPRDGRPETVESLGGGWVAEEALAIALYAALASDGLDQGLQIALVHGGDSDSTAAIAGNLLGLLYPHEVASHPLLGGLGGRDLIEDLALRLALHRAQAEARHVHARSKTATP